MSSLHRRPGAMLALTALAVATAALTVPSSATAQSAQEILTRALEAHDARLAGVENLTVTQEVMGISMTSYMVRETVDGRSVLIPRSTRAPGFEGELELDAAEAFWTDPHELYESAADRWALRGSGSVAGRDTWSLQISDFDGLDLDLGIPDGAGAFDLREMTMEMDRELLVPLHVSLNGEVRDGGQPRPVGMELHFSDYREVEGYLHPFVTAVEMDLASSGISEDELAQARTGMAELQRQLQEMPEAQRQMVQGMMQEQLQAMEAVLAGEGLELELRVLDLQVNNGPPAGR